MAGNKSVGRSNGEESVSGEGDLMSMGGGELESLSRKAQKALALKKRHMFWETQPVGQYNNHDGDKGGGEEEQVDGPIEAPQPLSDVRQEPYNLPSNYEWCTCDITDEKVMKEVYTLLTNNYVEDDDNMFRFDYSVEFLRWALNPPGYFPDWHLGVHADSYM